MNQPIRLGFALTGSFCTFPNIVAVLEKMLQSKEYDIIPILSAHAATMDTRFGTAAEWRDTLERMTGKSVIDTIQGAEPIGPKGLLDVLVIAPCTGNTLAKLAHSITDTPVTMAAKSQLRCDRPVVLAISTNDGLAGSAVNLGTLLCRRNYFFVPFGQDAPMEKPRSLVADMMRIPDTVYAAQRGEQVQPVLLPS